MNVLVGIKTSGAGQRPLFPVGGKTSSADRLRLFLGLSVRQYLRAFPIRINVLEHPGGGPALREYLEAVSATTFVLGREAWRLLGHPRRGWFEIEQTQALWVLLPHPSGRNVVYNSKASRERAKRVVYRYLEQEEEKDGHRGNRGPPSGAGGGPADQKAGHAVSISVDAVLGEAK